MTTTSLVVDCRGLSAALSVLRIKQAMSCYEQADKAFGVVVDPTCRGSVSAALGADGRNIQFLRSDRGETLLAQRRAKRSGTR